MTQRERQLLEWIRENPMISQQELAEKAGITRSSAAVHISSLMKKGYIAGRGYLLRTDPYIVVVGGVNMDIGAVSHAPLVARDSNPGRVTTSLGGVGRNIAHNLCLLGEQVSMVTVLGQDSFAQSVRENAAAIGLDLTHSAVIPDGRTGTYLFIDDSDGDMALAVNDMAIYDHMTPDFLRQRLDFMNHADLVVVETNLPESSLHWLCEHCTAPLLADPVSTIKAPKLKPVLGRLTALKPNRMEAELLSGMTIETDADAARAAEKLLETGLQQVYISLGGDGLYAADRQGHTARVACPRVQIANATGGGDAVAAALAACGVPLPPPLPWNRRLNLCGEVEHLLQKLRNGEQPSPILLFVANRAMAVEISLLAQSLKLKIPEELSIVTFIRRSGMESHLPLDTYDFNHVETQTNNPLVLNFLKHYTNYRKDIITPGTELYELKQEYDKNPTMKLKRANHKKNSL